MSEPKHKLAAMLRIDYRVISWSPEDGLRAVDHENEDVNITIKEAADVLQRLAKASEDLEKIVRKVSCLMQP